MPLKEIKLSAVQLVQVTKDKTPVIAQWRARLKKAILKEFKDATK